MATYICPTCSQDDFENAVYNLATSSGDIIVLPAGSATWGNSGRVNSGIIFLETSGVMVQGQGVSTNITLDDSGSASGVIAINATTIFSSIQINGSNSTGVAAFSVGSFSGSFRITSINYVGGSGAGYYVNLNYGANYGVIDSCQIEGGAGNHELIFGRGPSNAWQLPNTLGGANNIFIENNTFSGLGYVCDANANAGFVIRYNTITGTIKVDGHGSASNSPARSFRNMEVYGNHWTNTAVGFWSGMEIRGGTSRIFSNTMDNTYSGWLYLEDYGYQAEWPNFGNVFQTLINYPILDQVGVGEDPKAAASEPAYVWGNVQAGSAWPRSTKSPDPGAITLYQSQTSNPSATFTERDIIQSNRDFFSDAGFDTDTGVSIGTTAAMNAYTPSLTGYGWWATDQGSWNTTLPANTSGLLYVWNGLAWALNYAPYTYPNPLRGAGPLTAGNSPSFSPRIGRY